MSAKTVVDNLDRSRYDVAVGFIAPDGRWLALDPELLDSKVGEKTAALARRCPPLAPLGKLRPDAVIPVLHGPLGEDGAMQGLLEIEGLAYWGCGVHGSAVGMDKETTKILALAAGLPVLPYVVLHHPKEAGGVLKKLGLPVFVKPARLGSSVGVSKVKTAPGLSAALRAAFLYDDKVIVEKGIDAREIECAVLGDPWAKPSDPLALKATSVCGEVAPAGGHEFYSYESKYLDPNGSKLMLPAPISKALNKKIRDLSLRAFRALDGYGMARVDFLVDKKTLKPWFNEANTLPGFTAMSQYPLLWRHSGLPTPKLLDRLIALAQRRRDARARLKTAP